jgi:hypothetical protein
MKVMGGAAPQLPVFSVLRRALIGNMASCKYGAEKSVAHASSATLSLATD